MSLFDLGHPNQELIKTNHISGVRVDLLELSFKSRANRYHILTNVTMKCLNEILPRIGLAFFYRRLFLPALVPEYLK